MGREAAPLLPLIQTSPSPPLPAPTPSPSPEATTRDAVAEALTEAARRHFGDRFPTDQAADVRESIVDNLRAAERLRALNPANADEPVTAFSARRGKNGLPTSLQFLGRAFSETTLLELAHRYQQATDWHKRRPAPEHLPAAGATSRGAPPTEWIADGEPGRSDINRL